MSKCEEWEKHLKMLEKVIKKNSCLIVSSRNSVISENQFAVQNISIFKVEKTVIIKRAICTSLDVTLRELEIKSILKRETHFIEKKPLSVEIFEFNHRTILESVLLSYTEEED